MSNKIELTKTDQPSVIREENSQELSILLQRVLGYDDTPEFSKEQIDELLSQKREITGFIHKDKLQDSWDNKFYLVVILVFILIFSGLVMWKQPDLFNEVLSFLAGVFGGALGGYGLASRKK